MEGLQCTICHNVFKQKHSLLLHIGCKHGKVSLIISSPSALYTTSVQVNEVLLQKGFAALPCPVNATSSAAMQKQLIQIKKEKMENHEVKDEGSVTLQEIAAPKEAEKTSSLDEILKKYKFTTGAGGQIKKM